MTRMCASGTMLLEAAASEAISAAWWERVDLEARRPGEGHAELILDKAAELAFSPIGRDQLMSLALEKGVRDPGGPEPLVETSVPPAERMVIAKRVFQHAPHRTSETEALVARIEKRNARQLGHDTRYDLLPQRMRQEAALQEVLWDHPAIPAGDDVRLAMFCSVPKLLERSEALSDDWPWRILSLWIAPVIGRDAS